MLSTQLHRHRAIARASISALALALAAAVSAGGAAQAGLTAILPEPPSILPVSVGVGIATDAAVNLTFAHEMDRTSVEEALNITPGHTASLAWSSDSQTLRVIPQGLWATDQRYLLVVAASARSAGGALLGAPARYAFTTQTAPRIEEFGLDFVVAEPARGPAVLDAGTRDAIEPPPDIASGVSAETSIQITFSVEMNHDQVERAFLFSPALPGIFSWSGNTLTFSPIERLASDARYAVSLTGVHDLDGNPLGGDGSFSFTTQAGGQMVQSTPASGATRVSDTEIVLWFSQPMDPDAAAGLLVRDRSTGNALSGSVAWNPSHTQLRFTPTRAFAAGHRFDVSLADGALDADGNPVAAGITFTTRATATRVTVARAAPSATLVEYALNQVNAARAAYGLPPVVLDAAISAVSLAHAWDQVNNGYFGHNSPNGSTPQDRLRAAGFSFGWSGENLCYNNNSGRTTTGTLDWCQAQFMSEPYPGVANHIGNILSTHYTRVGIGIAVSGGKVIVVWDFTG